MKVKGISVLVYETCELCPYCSYEVHRWNDTYSCDHPKANRLITTEEEIESSKDAMNIPDWCPLEDVNL